MTAYIRIVAIALVCSLIPYVHAQQTIYVNGATGNDAWDGFCEQWDGGTCGPKATIMAGIGAAQPGDTVVVADGTYAGSGNVEINYSGKAVTLRSANGPDNCVIDCEDDGRGVAFGSGATPEFVLEGFTIVRGFVDGDGAGIRCRAGAQPTITNCRITDCTADGGGAIYCENSSPTISNCLIAWSVADHGAGIYCYNSSPTISHCTVTQNHADYGAGIHCADQSSPTISNSTISLNVASSTGGAFHCVHSSPLIINCVLWHNRASDFGTAMSCAGIIDPVTMVNSVAWCSWEYDETSLFHVLWEADIDASYSVIKGGWPGVGNITSTADFVYPGIDDFHLNPGSPCIDAGDPGFVPQPDDVDPDGQMRVWDGDGDSTARVDIGIDEFGSYAHGDMNCDGVNDNFDIDAFVLALTDPSGYGAAYPACDSMLADCDHDGSVSNFDIDAFIDLLAG